MSREHRPSLRQGPLRHNSVSVCTTHRPTHVHQSSIRRPVLDHFYFRHAHFGQWSKTGRLILLTSLTQIVGTHLKDDVPSQCLTVLRADSGSSL